VAPDPQKAKVVAFPDLSPATRKDLMRGELGTQFDQQSRVFGLYAGGDVFDYGEWTAREVSVMLTRDGQAAALESVLTLPIRQASRAIEPSKGDSGEAELCNSVLFAPGTSGGMKTPLQDVIGQVTSSQIYKKSFHELCWAIRERDGAIVLDSIAFRPTATCELKRDAKTGRMDGFRQQTWQLGGFARSPITTKQGTLPGYVDIPRVKSFVHINGRHREPLTGTSELDLTYWALAHGSEVQTPDGPVLIEDIRRGDLVFGGNGQPTRVTAVHPRGKRQMYRVTLRDGSSAECDEEHLWGVYDAQREGGYRVVSTREMLATGLRRGTTKPLWRYSVPGCGPAEYPERDLPIDPYVLGAWLGDGSIQKAADGGRRYGPKISCYESDEWIAEEIRRRLPPDMKLVQAPGSTSGDYRFCPVVSHDVNPFRDSLVLLGVNRRSPERFIPALYLQASVKQRLDLLRGLMDTDGSVTRGSGMQVRFYTTSPQLASDVRLLVRSLGGTATQGSSPGRRTMHVDIFTDQCPFLLPRKAAAWEEGGGGDRRGNGNTIVGIEASGSSECRCITVAARDGLFLVNDFMTTHNCYRLRTKLKLLFLLGSGTSSLSPKVCLRSSCTARTSVRRTRGPTTSRQCALVAWPASREDRRAPRISKSFPVMAVERHNLLTPCRSWRRGRPHRCWPASRG
jgi:hypothetical protein